MKIQRLITAILLIIPGALMIADAVLVKIGDGAIFFPDINANFEAVVGIALIILGSSQMDNCCEHE